MAVVVSILLATVLPLVQAESATPLGAKIAPHGKIASAPSHKDASMLARKPTPAEAKVSTDSSAVDGKARQEVKDVDKEVQIDIYYEALCPYCQKIIGEEVRDLWNDADFRERVNMRFWPYGNAATIPVSEVSEGYRFWHEEIEGQGLKYVFPCQHGQDECFGNLLHNCAIDELKVASKYVPFITCMEVAATRESAEMASYECAQNASLDLTKLKSCVRGRRGNMLLYAAGEKTNGLAGKAGPREYVPWIVINDEHVENAELDGEPDQTGHLAVAVCNRLTLPHPTGCAAAYKAMKVLNKNNQEKGFLFRAVSSMLLHSSAKSLAAPGIVTAVLAVLAGLRQSA